MNRLFKQMKTIFSVVLLLIGTVLHAQTAHAPEVSKGLSLDTNTILVLFAVFLLLPIWILSNMFITSAKRYYADRTKSDVHRILLPIGMIMLSSSLWAQAPVSKSAFGVSASTMTIALICIISVEMLMIVFFAAKTNQFIQRREPRVISQRNVIRELGIWGWIREKWSSMNFKPIEEEHKLDTGHSYDGIRELDNVIPPWFTTAFILSIIFACVYMYRYHVAKSAPLMIEEYEIEMAKAELEHDKYLSMQANSIDESTVALMSGADIEAGKKIFVSLCAACHKTDGGGLVGPNLTDEYWLHGGSLKDIFKTVKYGVPEKGMISWKEQLNPQQMAQVSNFILTLKGTNPPDPKEKQGELYTPETSMNQDTTIKADTIKIQAIDTTSMK